MALCVLGLTAVSVLVVPSRSAREPLTSYVHFQNNQAISPQPASIQIRPTSKDSMNPVMLPQLIQDTPDLLNKEGLRDDHDAGSKSSNRAQYQFQPFTKIKFSKNLSLNSISSPKVVQSTFINLQSTSALSEVIDVPVGVTIPAALAQMDSKSSLDVVSQKEVEVIAESFFQSLDAETQSGVSPEWAWRKQQQLADELFRARYGWEAFNAESARANQQAKSQ